MAKEEQAMRRGSHARIGVKVEESCKLVAYFLAHRS